MTIVHRYICLHPYCEASLPAEAIMEARVKVHFEGLSTLDLVEDGLQPSGSLPVVEPFHEYNQFAASD